MVDLLCCLDICIFVDSHSHIYMTCTYIQIILYTHNGGPDEIPKFERSITPLPSSKVQEHLSFCIHCLDSSLHEYNRITKSDGNNFQNRLEKLSLSMFIIIIHKIIITKIICYLRVKIYCYHQYIL